MQIFLLRSENANSDEDICPLDLKIPDISGRYGSSILYSMKGFETIVQYRKHPPFLVPIGSGDLVIVHSFLDVKWRRLENVIVEGWKYKYFL